MTCCRVHSVVDPAARVLRTPSMDPQVHDRPSRAVVFTGATILLAAALLTQLVRVHSLRGDPGVSALAFGVLSVLLVATELHPTRWTRVGERDGVTRGWAFAYALILVGSPVLAIAVMVTARCYVNLARGKGPVEIVFNAAQIAAGLSLGSLVLALFGVYGSIGSAGTISIVECLGIVLGGFAIFALNGVLTATAIGLEQGPRFGPAARSAFWLSRSADGALLVLAPVFAIAVESDLVTVPLVGLTVVIASRSLRDALRRRHLGGRDRLTQLPDRTMFVRQLRSALDAVARDDGDDGHGVAVFALDLDRFRHVNDSFGHRAGDLVLTGFAERLVTVLPPGSITGRLGGDEFAALVPTGEIDGQLPNGLGRLDELLAEHHRIDGVEVVTSASIGVAFAPASGTDVDVVLEHAHRAMLVAKARGSGLEVAGQRTGSDAPPRDRPDSESTGSIGTGALQLPRPDDAGTLA